MNANTNDEETTKNDDTDASLMGNRSRHVNVTTGDGVRKTMATTVPHLAVGLRLGPDADTAVALDEQNGQARGGRVNITMTFIISTTP